MVFTVSDSQESGLQEVGKAETNLTKVLIATNSTLIIEICSGGQIKGHLTIKYNHTMADRILKSFTYFDFLRVGWKI
jgi:uncharacterized protein (DUF1919 family)